MEHQQYITTRDTYRIDKDLEFKWTGTHNGFISDVWKMPSISLCKRASINRLIYDKGWHMEVTGPKLNAPQTRKGKNGSDVGTVGIQTLKIIGYENSLMIKQVPFVI
jgi:hypothetical protein